MVMFWLFPFSPLAITLPTFSSSKTGLPGICRVCCATGLCTAQLKGVTAITSMTGRRRRHDTPSPPSANRRGRHDTPSPPPASRRGRHDNPGPPPSNNRGRHDTPSPPYARTGKRDTRSPPPSSHRTPQREQQRQQHHKRPR